MVKQKRRSTEPVFSFHLNLVSIIFIVLGVLSLFAIDAGMFNNGDNVITGAVFGLAIENLSVINETFVENVSSNHTVNLDTNNTNGLIIIGETISPELVLIEEAIGSMGKVVSGLTDTIEIFSGVSPLVTSALINSTDPTLNSTDENLTAHVTATDGESDPLKLIYNWFLNDDSISLLNLPFESDAVNNTTDYSSFDIDPEINGAIWNSSGGHDAWGSFEFDGSNDYMDLGNPSYFPSGASVRTMCLWAKPETIGSGFHWASAYGSASGGQAYFIGRNGATFYGGGFADDITISGFWVADEWKHVCLTYDGTTASVYANGEFNTSASKTWNTVLSRAYIGRQVNNAEYWDGTVDDVLLYNRSLSADQILLLYNNQSDFIASQETNKEDLWNYSVTPVDGTSDGITTFSYSILVQSFAPNITSILINSTNPRLNGTNENLTSHILSVDPNGDKIKEIYSWYLNGSPLMSFNLPFEDDGANQITDYSGRNVATALVNSPTFNSTGGIDGNGSYEFDSASSNYITVSDSFDPLAYTLEVWVKPNDITSTNIILRTDGNPGITWANQLRITSGSKFEHYTFDGSTLNVTGNTTIVAGSWYHVVATAQNNGLMTLYVNGVEDGVAQSIGTLQDLTLWHIGSNSGDGMGYFDGTIDEVRVYNRSLSSDQIFALYQNRTDLIVSGETSVEDSWKLLVTPVAGSDNGISRFSNTLTIEAFIDIVAPNVTTLIPTLNSVYNISNIIQIAANVTDETNLGNVYSEILFPNGSLKTYVLSNGTDHRDKFNSSFTLPTLPGDYSITFLGNDSSSNLNNSETSNFTVNDVVNVSVGSLVPVVNSVYNVSNVIEINATVTDDVNVSRVFANVTFPNGTVEQYELGLNSSDIYNTTFTIPALVGDYSITYFANDSSGNENRTENTNFSINDVVNVSVGSLVPSLNSVFGVSDVIEINATVTDDVAVSRVFANVTFPNGTVEQYELGLNFSDIYNTTFTIPAVVGDYNITYFSNDSSGNENRTESTNFSVNDVVAPHVWSLVPVVNSIFNVSNVIEINATVIDDVNVSRVFANVTFPNGTVEQIELGLNDSDIYNITFTIPAVVGDYNITYFANDSSGNENRTESTNFTINDITNVSVDSLIPVLNSVFNVSNVIEINATVTDDVNVSRVFANVTFPNGTVESLELMFFANNVYNTNFVKSNLTGDYNITYFANDSSGNENRSESTNFSVVDSQEPIIVDFNPNLDSSFITGSTIEVALNVTDNYNVSRVFANITLANGTLEESELIFDTDHRYNTTYIIPSGVNGSYNITFIVNDSSSNFNTSNFTNFTVNLIDVDNDGVDDILDTLIGNKSDVSTTGVTSLNVSVDDGGTNGTYTGLHTVTFYDESTPLLNFSHNFSVSGLNLSNITIVVGSESIVVNLSDQIQRVYNKTLFLSSTSTSALCVKDAPIDSVSEISSACSGDNETDFSICIDETSQITKNFINCFDDGSIFTVSNLAYSGLRTTATVAESTESSSSASSGSGGGGGGGGGFVPNKKVEVECTEKSDCATQYFCVQNQCKKIFDLKIIKFDSPAKTSGEFSFQYYVKPIADISNDVKIDFWIEHPNGDKVTKGSDTIFVGAFEDKVEQGALFLPSTLAPGIYTFFIKLNYEEYVVISERTIEILIGEKGEVIVEDKGEFVFEKNNQKDQLQKKENLFGQAIQLGDAIGVTSTPIFFFIFSVLFIGGFLYLFMGRKKGDPLKGWDKWLRRSGARGEGNLVLRLLSKRPGSEKKHLIRAQKRLIAAQRLREIHVVKDSSLHQLFVVISKHVKSGFSEKEIVDKCLEQGWDPSAINAYVSTYFK